MSNYNQWTPKFNARQLFGKDLALAEQLRQAAHPVYDATLLLGAAANAHANLSKIIRMTWLQATQMERLSSQLREYASVFRAQQDLINSTGFEQMFSRLGQLGIGTWMDRQADQMHHLEEAIGRIGVTINHAPFTALRDSLSVLGATTEFVKISPQFAEAASRLPRAYVLFSRGLTERILNVQTENEGDSAALVLDHGGAMLGDSSSALQQTIEAGPEGELPQLELPSRFNLFTMLQLTVASRYSRMTTQEFSEILNNGPAMLINSLGCAIVGSVIDLNKTAGLANGKILFQPSVRTMEAGLLLPNHVATNENEFARVVDALYFMLWEASGTHGGMVYKLLTGTQHFGPLAAIRDLRRVFRHDLEQGSGVEKKLIKGGDVFRRLINRSSPQTSVHWREAQIALYREIYDMLHVLHKRLDSGA